METSGQVSTSFSWVEFYKEFADKLFQYKDNRTELLVILESVFKDLGMKYPFTDKGVPESDICPSADFEFQRLAGWRRASGRNRTFQTRHEEALVRTSSHFFAK